jgi:DNA-directed RNA polymerase III subunit RPC3
VPRRANIEVPPDFDMRQPRLCTPSNSSQRIFSVLARHGRQTLAALARASYLNGRQIKYGLVILLQQHLIFHSGSDASVTYYEIDWENSYALVRFGKVTKLVEDRFGKKAANVVSNLLTLGHTRMADLKDAYFPPDTDSDDDSDDGTVNGASSKRKRANGTHVNGIATKPNGVANGVPSELDDAKPSNTGVVNGEATVNGVQKPSRAKGTVQQAAVVEETPHESVEQDQDEIASAEELYDIIQLLIERGWIRIMDETQYLSPGDMHDMLHQEALEEVTGGPAATGKKDKEEVHRKYLRKKRQMRDRWLTAPRFSRKRQADEPHQNGANKRQKLNNKQNRSMSGTSLPEDDFIIRVNPAKIPVGLRTEQLVQLVEQRLGPVTAYIYQTMLRMLEKHMSHCYEQWPEPPPADGEPHIESGIDPLSLITARDVAKMIPRDFDVCEGLDPNAVVGITRRGHVRTSNILSQPVDPNKLGMDQKTELVDKHIRLLAEDPLHFATWHTRAGFSQWHIEFEEIAKQLIQTEVENTISARKGALGVKLIRALRKKGKLDERAACNAMMMSANDIRGIVNDLTVAGFVQTQEIPKVERREAKHSLHLIWYDRQRAREKLLHDTYKGMVRILQRIAFEREKVQPLLSKAERSDVVGNEEKWLSKGELDALKKWKEVQEKLLLQLSREDDLVATLRDFHGPLISV